MYIVQLWCHPVNRWAWWDQTNSLAQALAWQLYYEYGSPHGPARILTLAQAEKTL